MKILQAALILLFSGQLDAIEPRCVRVNDLYAVNFTAYHALPPERLQKMDPSERKLAMRPYCDAVPEVGKIYFGVDLLDRDTRKMPVWMPVVKLVRGEDGEMIEGPVIAKSDPEVHRNGSLQLAAQIEEPGRYLVIVTFGEEAALPEDELRIPITIGQSPPWQERILPYLSWLFGGLLLFSMAGFAAVWWRRHRA